MSLWTGFLLGLVGSLHCAGMCGPLAMALPHYGRGALSFYLGRVNYNLGRIIAYGCLGVIFGLAGKSVALVGMQRWTSLLAGAAILISLLPGCGRALGSPGIRLITLLKTRCTSLLRERTMAAPFLLGFFNGFLPCGLVYVAGASALAGGDIQSGVTFMLGFGFGTLPLMFGIGVAGRSVQLALRFRSQKLIPICMVLMGSLLLLRGMSLGIPYLSPDLSAAPASVHSCH